MQQKPFLTVLEKEVLDFMTALINDLGGHEGLFVQKTMYEVIFGYNDTVLDIIDKIVDFAAARNITLPLLYIDNHYALQNNNSAETRERKSVVMTGKVC